MLRLSHRQPGEYCNPNRSNIYFQFHFASTGSTVQHCRQKAGDDKGSRQHPLWASMRSKKKNTNTETTIGAASSSCSSPSSPSPQSGLSWQENEIAFAVAVVVVAAAARVQFISTWASARLKDSTPFLATPPPPAAPPSPPPTLFAALSCIIKVAGKWLLPTGSRLEKRHGTQFVCLSTNLAIRQGLGVGGERVHCSIIK